jgi:hypothetical protein
LISANRLGFASAALTATISAIFFAAGILTPARSGPFCVQSGHGSCIVYPYVSGLASFVPIDYLWLYPGFLLAFVFVVLMACIHRRASDDKKVFSQIALSFALVYAVVIIIDYWIQLVVVEPSILSGQTEGLSLFTQYNPHGIFISLECLAYLMMSVALLFEATVLGGGRLERTIGRLFVASFVLVVGALISLSLLGYDIVAFEVTVLLINWTVLIVSGALLSVVFKRTGTTMKDERMLPNRF